MPVAEELKKVVACPKCKGAVVYNETEDGFECRACNLLYRVQEGIPNFIIEEAEELKQP